MQEILRGENFLARWHDDEHTIMVIEILNRWTWDDAYAVLPKLSEIVRATPHEVYSIFWFKHEMPHLPQGMALPKIQGLMKLGNPNEPLVVFVTANSVLETFVQITSRIYRLRDFLMKYRFVRSFEHALKVVEKHKQSAVR